MAMKVKALIEELLKLRQEAKITCLNSDEFKITKVTEQHFDLESVEHIEEYKNIPREEELTHSEETQTLFDNQKETNDVETPEFPQI